MDDNDLSWQCRPDMWDALALEQTLTIDEFNQLLFDEILSEQAREDQQARDLD